MSLIPSERDTKKRPGLFALAIVLFILSGMTLAFGSHNFLVRSCGLIALLLGVSLIRISGVRNLSNLPGKEYQWSAGKASGGPGRLAWVIGIASLPILGLSILLMHDDAIHGGHQAWPVYVFAGVGIVFTVVWSYIVAKSLQ
jgi:hypothetical protein